jgi:hypothetical protein
MRDGDLKYGESDAGEEPEEHPDDGEDEDEKEGEGHKDDSGGVEDTGAVDYEEVNVDVDRDGDAGDYLCLFTATAPRTRFQFSPRFEFNRAA